ncbi:Integrase catalytic domain-containing protein [Mycena venus]|uniref:Integrase catalytic domain-containing protein n=1 Tax=Mycena venus TaxID=2733690 RepID=A0A8H7CKE4_9AGAR|nr:Integrase catalytic domain-containing protein [Mycena venus]
MAHPAEFPPLPHTPEEFTWPLDVLKAHDIISVGYERAAALLRQEEGDPLRLRIHAEDIIGKLVPILEALEPEVGDQEWLEACAHALGALTVTLHRAAAVADGVETTKLKHIAPIYLERTGQKPGRPRKVVDPVWLADSVSPHRKLTLQAIADGLGMHRNTLQNYLKLYGVYHRYLQISDADLDILTKKFKQGKPDSGLRYLISFLRTHGVKVQKERVRQSLRRVDRLGQVLRRHMITRRQYFSPRPNSVWHMDGHHKLIKWGIVIHGFVDGFDRMINEACEEFQTQWNHHPISGRAGNDQTPADMRLIGELKYGKYADTFDDDVHPEVLETYGNSIDLDEAIANDQAHNVRHEAVGVAETKFPFRSERVRDIFVAALADVQAAGIIPENFGVAEAEWEVPFYGESENVKIGRKQVEITLPFPIWWPRAVAWVQALDLMVRIQEAERN